jgi:hypothetical protein
MRIPSGARHHVQTNHAKIVLLVTRVLLRLNLWACLSTPEEESAAAEQKNQDDDNQQRLGTHSWILWRPTHTALCPKEQSYCTSSARRRDRGLDPPASQG